MFLTAEAEIQVSQMEDMLRTALIKCEIDPSAMDCGKPVTTGKQVKQTVVLRHGLDSAQCKNIVKQVKDATLKEQAQIPAAQEAATVAQIKTAFLALSDPNDWTGDSVPEGWLVIDRAYTTAEAR